MRGMIDWARQSCSFGSTTQTCAFGAVQITDAIAEAADKLTAAGAILVPFNSSMFETLSTTAWPGPIPAGSLDGATQYESTDTLARYTSPPAVHICHLAWWAICQQHRI